MYILHNILNTLDSVGPAIACSFLLLHRKKLSDDIIIILIFCLIQLLCNTVATFMDIVLKTNNYWVYKINSTASFLCILYLFSRKLIQIKSTSFYLLLTGYIAISVILMSKGDGIWQFNSISAAVESIIIVGLCLYFFYTKLINTSEEISIPETSIFWCVVGIFIYYAGAFFIFISYKYLIDSDNSAVGVLWRFHNILLFICCCYISYGVLCKNYRTILS